eukprot:4857189-Alexandrium_andersonii.AAC.1
MSGAPPPGAAPPSSAASEGGAAPAAAVGGVGLPAGLRPPQISPGLGRIDAVRASRPWQAL